VRTFGLRGGPFKKKKRIKKKGNGTNDYNQRGKKKGDDAKHSCSPVAPSQSLSDGSLLANCLQRYCGA